MKKEVVRVKVNGESIVRGARWMIEKKKVRTSYCNRAMELLPCNEFGLLLCTALFSLSTEQWEAYYTELMEALVGGPEGT